MRIRLLGGKKDDEGEAQAALAVSGDLRIAGHASFPNGLVTHGNLVVEPDARIEGDVRVGGMLAMGAGAHISGDVTVEGKAVVAADASVGGHLACRQLLLRAGRAPVKQAAAEAEVVGARPA